MGILIRRVWILRVLHAFRRRFLFTPVACLLVGASLPWLVPDLALDVWQPAVGARQSLSIALAGTYFGVCATTFSLVMAVLSLASSQFGPRLVRQFLQDGVAQLTLGVLLGGSAYHLSAAILVAVSGPLVFWLGIVMAAIGGVVFVVFVEHLAHGIHVDVIMEGVASELQALTSSMAPTQDHRDVDPPDVTEGVLRVPANGYLQGFDLSALAATARKLDIRLTVCRRPGAHVLEGESLAMVDRELTSDESTALLRSVWIGPRRDATQDPEFLLEHLSEIAVRALSPGINDSYTAERSIHSIVRALRQFDACAPLHRVICDREDAPRIWMRWPTFQEMLDAGTHRVSHSARTDPGVLLILSSALDRLADAVDDPATIAACRGRAIEVLDGAELSAMSSAHSATITARRDTLRRGALSALPRPETDRDRGV